MRCPSPEKLSAARSLGASESMRGHLKSCDRCAAEWAALDRLSKLAQELPDAPALHAAEKEEARERVLAAARAEPVHSPARDFRDARAAALGFALAASIAGLIVAARPDHVPHAPAGALAVHRATLRSEPSTTWERTGAQPDEIVRLRGGTLSIEVDHLKPGERFRVITGDGEVEVRGTSFDVTADGDHLQSVSVRSGRVEVRAAGVTHVLDAGDRWERSDRGLVAVTPRPSASATPMRLAMASATTLPPTPPPVSRTAAESAFDEGFHALRSGDAAAASASFERAMALAGDAPIVEDCAFWRAVSLARAGRADSARAAFAFFLVRFPTSPRHGEASVMLGSMLMEAGDLEAASRRFQEASEDAVPEVNRAARQGIEEVQVRRSTQPNR